LDETKPAPADRSWVPLVAAMAYELLPVDLLPDAIPGLGFLDDAAISAGAIALTAWWRRGRGWWDLLPLALALGYDASPIDLIPDIPVVGQGDDLAVTLVAIAAWWLRRRAHPAPPPTP
jgi:uncharacterized membrane protein YkvA (DUF1232 family)